MSPPFPPSTPQPPEERAAPQPHPFSVALSTPLMAPLLVPLSELLSVSDMSSLSLVLDF